MSNEKNKKTNPFKRVGHSFQEMFTRLFSFHRNKHAISVLEEEQLMSPAKMIFRRFIKNRLALIGIIGFLFMTFFSFILSAIIPYDANYQDTTQGNLAPNIGYLNYPNAINKEGIKFLTSGGSFSIAVSEKNQLYFWGANTTGVKKNIPQFVKDHVSWITDIDAGNDHVVVLLENPETHEQYVQMWGSNGHMQSQIPTRKDNEVFGDTVAEREQIMNYFNNVFDNIYKYPVKITPPEIKNFQLDYENSSKTLVKGSYDFTDESQILTKITLVYGAPVDKKTGRYIGSFVINNLDNALVLFDKANNIDEKTFEIPVDPSKIYLFALKYEFVRLDVVSSGYTAGLPFNTYATADNNLIPNDFKNFDALSNVPLAYEEVNIGGISTDPIIDVQADYDYTSVLTKSGKLLTWGSTDINSVNNTIRNEKDKPIVAFATSLNDVITLRSDNSVAIFGLPGGVATVGSDPEEKAMLEEFRKPLSVRTGDYASAVKFIGITDKNGIIITENNKIFTWGDPTTGLNDVPASLNGKDIIDLQTGLRHYVVLTSDGQVITWGKNELNQLNVPKKATNIDKLFIDYFQNYAVAKDGKLFAWGNKGYLFGTDSEGRSLLVRLIQGGKVSMTVGAISVLISMTIGSIIGLISGFYGGVIDNVLMRFGEIVNAFPFLPLAITLSAFIGTGMSADSKMYLIMVILGVLSWPGLSRLIRGQILSEREKDFVTAAKALGIREKNIITRHILPSVVNIIIVDATLSYAGSLLTEAGLSFLGFGVQKPYPSWGNLLDDAKKMETIQLYWWKWIIPALCIVITALCINLVGDGLREAMDPKSNER